MREEEQNMLAVMADETTPGSRGGVPKLDV